MIFPGQLKRWKWLHLIVGSSFAVILVKKITTQPWSRGRISVQRKGKRGLLTPVLQYLPYLFLLLVQKHWCYALETSWVGYDSNLLSWFAKPIKIPYSLDFWRNMWINILPAKFCKILFLNPLTSSKRHCDVNKEKRRHIPILLYQNHKNRRYYSENLGRGGNHPFPSVDEGLTSFYFIIWYCRSSLMSNVTYHKIYC